MPPRLPTLRYTTRLLRPKQFARCISRPYSKSPPLNPSPLPNPYVRFPIIAGGIALTAGITFYALSCSSNAEAQASTVISASENRELMSSVARVPVETLGKTETSVDQLGRPSRDVKKEHVIAAEKPKSGASEENSQTGKLTGTHDESGQHQRERTQRDKSEERTRDETRKEGSEEQEEDESGNGRGPVDPETGEINWDCPCLGDMPHGTCGQEFRAAFSCFVHSTAEPKGEDCIEAFKAMQDCFRAHPEEYAPMDDLDDDELDEESPEAFETATATEIGDRRLERQPEAHGNGNGNGNGNSNSNNKKEKQKEKSP